MIQLTHNYHFCTEGSTVEQKPLLTRKGVGCLTDVEDPAAL